VSTYRADKGVRLATYCSRCIENEILMYFRSRRKSAGDVLLSDVIETDKEGNGISLMDVISVEDDVLEDLAGAEARARLTGYVASRLTPREERIIRMRYGVGGGAPMTQKDAAGVLGISRSYVSRIEKRALEKLRAAFEEDDALP
jgi:RNA polymerase sporulation-specific sigma factor